MRQKENALRAQAQETMNMAYADIGKGLFKYLPMLAIVYAGYQYYAGRGFQGFLNDINAITWDGIMAKIYNIAVGFALILAAPFVAKYVPNVSLRHIVKAVMYYVGASQLFQALRSGAGYGGRRLGFNPAMRQVVG